ncbi:YgaC family protein [Glutamicibacter sp. JL.03c]|uniref:YgaC family protein n=1 Tax=Glutamicibacter sp. JL.03c TaxID=2984842 RepID=UPI0021F76843|nr:YgaC family protein [Glutamicibacter sp. JL.03c]UYQ76311.1 YgaC family protein [Glutamicibacter sp. JL.03c]
MSNLHGFPVDLPRNPEDISVGALVVARAWKYNGLPHWVVPGFYLGSDQYGHWLHQPAGSLVARPGAAHLARTNALCLIPLEGSWVATLYADPADDFDVYIDLSLGVGWRPLQQGGWEVNSVDLDLDVIRSRSRGTFLDDEDEFAEHGVSMGYPEELKAEIRAASDTLLDAVHRDEPPFNHSHRQHWLDQANQLHHA